MAKTSIEWATDVWNPVTGCTKVSQGCKNCYAKTLHDMRHKAYQEGKKLPAQYATPFETVQLHPERLDDPLHWKKPRRVFVNSMSDLFHKDVPDEFIYQVFKAMSRAHWHLFMILTKRPERMPNLVAKIRNMLPDRLNHVWLGVSVEDQKAAGERIPYLLQTPAAVRFVSCEPLLGPVDLVKVVSDYRNKLLFLEETGIDWVIAGGESGPDARPMHPDWARSLREQCQGAGVPFFFKQHGDWMPVAAQYGDDDLAFNLDMDAHNICLGNRGTVYSEDDGLKRVYWCGFQPDPGQNPWFMERVGKKSAGRLLDGREWNEFPGGGE